MLHHLKTSGRYFQGCASRLRAVHESDRPHCPDTPKEEETVLRLTATRVIAEVLQHAEDLIRGPGLRADDGLISCQCGPQGKSEDRPFVFWTDFWEAAVGLDDIRIGLFESLCEVELKSR